MIRLMLTVFVLAIGFPGETLAQKVLVFVDGTQLPVQSFEVKGQIVQFTTDEGKLRSVPRSYINMVATEQVNRGQATSSPARPSAPTSPAPRPPSRGDLPSQTVEPAPAPVTPVEPAPTASAPPPVVAPPPPPDLPPVWSNEELQVSLVVPSSEWRVQDMPASFDVAVSLENPNREAKATLALIRRKIRGRGDFRDVVEEIESTVSGAPGYRSLSEGAMDLEPYTAHEFRFLKDVGFLTVYNRLVVVYSRDLVYVLSLTCPEARSEDNAGDFDALVRGLVIRKSRNELTP